jgi:hypothetical protein
LLIASLKFAGVGADLPVLQPAARATKTTAVAARASEAGFLRTIFIASPINFTSWMQTLEMKQSMDYLICAVTLIFA